MAAAQHITLATKLLVRSATIGCMFILSMSTCKVIPGPIPAREFAKPTAKVVNDKASRVLGVYLISPSANLKPILYLSLYSLSNIGKVTAMITRPKMTSAASKDQSIKEHLSQPIKDGSLPEPRKSDTAIKANIIKIQGTCFLGCQFELSATVKASRIATAEASSDSWLETAMSIEEKRDALE